MFLKITNNFIGFVDKVEPQQKSLMYKGFLLTSISREGYNENE